MKRYKLTALEKFVLADVLIMLITGYVLFYTAPLSFANYVVEDGTVEWLTVAGLLAASLVCFARFARLLKKRHWWFLAVTLLLGLLLFFAAGEEISWGQRILHLKSSEFFEKNNAQHETNFHNLIVGGIKINRLVFSLLLGIVIGIYLLVIPILHQRYQGFRNFLKLNAVPVPRTYQVISFILLAIATTLLPNEKNAELLECGTALIFFLIITFPKNHSIFSNYHLRN